MTNGEGSSAGRRPAAMFVVLTLVVAGCGGGSAERGSVGSEESTTVASAIDRNPPSPPKCKDAEIRKAKAATYGRPEQIVSKGAKLTAVVRTNCGSFAIALDTERFPTVVNSFVFLARRGFYGGMPFHEAAAGKYLNGGDPPGKATGPGYTVSARIPLGFIYRHGVVAMTEPDQPAEGPGRAGSQFFIVLAKPWLDFSGIYPPLGKVKRGFDVLNAISHLGPHARFPSNVGVLGPVGELRRPVVIEKIAIEKG